MDKKYSNKLKIYAGKAVVESKLGKESKRQLLKFIQHEASDHQVMTLILDGKVTKLDEQATKIVEDRFECSKYSKIVADFKVSK